MARVTVEDAVVKVGNRFDLVLLAARRARQIASGSNPLVEKLFNEYAPKYAKRAEEKGQKGGYTRIVKLGERRGDAASMCILELL